MAKPIRVLLYYKYVPIENAEQFAADHLAFCKSIGLKGRILVADEGINGMRADPYAFASEVRPANASRLTRLDFSFDDSAWTVLHIWSNL